MQSSRDGVKIRALRRVLAVIGIMLAAIAIVVLLWLGVRLYVSPKTPSDRKDVLQTVAQAAGGAALLLGLFFTWKW